MDTVTSDELLFKALSGRTTHNRAALSTSGVYMILYNGLSFMRTTADREQLLYRHHRNTLEDAITSIPLPDLFILYSKSSPDKMSTSPCTI